MSASLTDKFRKGAPFFQTTLSGSMSDSDTTFTVASATGVPTDTAVDVVIDRIDQNGELLDPSLREVITGTVSGATFTTDATRRGLDNTTAQAHTAGAVVEVNFTADAWNDHIDGFLISHNQDGTHKADTVDTQAIENEAVTPAKRSGGFKIGVIPGSTFGTTGNKAITGVGFRPKLVRFNVLHTSSTGNASHSMGAMDENGNQFYISSASSSTPSFARNSSTTACIGRVPANSSTPVMDAVYVSMDADGFTVNCTTANSGFDVAYEAYG